MRAVIAIVAGLAAGFVGMFAIALMGGLIFPSTASMSRVSAEQVAIVFPTLPLGAKLAIIVSWFGGALIGAVTAKGIARAPWAAWTIGILFALYVLLTVMILPMPVWMEIVAVLAPVLGGFVGNHLVPGRASGETDLPA